MLGRRESPLRPEITLNQTPLVGRVNDENADGDQTRCYDYNRSTETGRFEA